MQRTPALLFSFICLTGCSPEAATTAATVGKLQASQAEAAKNQEEQFKQKLGAAIKAEEAAASDAGNQ